MCSCILLGQKEEKHEQENHLCFYVCMFIFIYLFIYLHAVVVIKSRAMRLPGKHSITKPHPQSQQAHFFSIATYNKYKNQD
jgi:hypothetical protein